MTRANSSTRLRKGLGALLLGMLAGTAAADPLYTIKPDAPDIIGELSLTTSVYEDTISDLARAYDQGFREMRLANPKVDAWLPGEGTEVLVPSLYVLPNAPRDGIVINVPEMRMYYYSGRGGKQVMTFPISIGREQWVTPKGRTSIVGKVKNPAWYPPESIRKEHAQEGDILPKVVPAGPDNPLGTHALQLGLNGYMIHGTDKPYGIGMRVTHGCIRMYPNDIVTMFNATTVGTPVYIVSQPFKIGLGDGNIYLEVHPPLEEDQQAATAQYSVVVQMILDRVKNYSAELVWADIKRTLDDANGIPQVVGTARPKTTTAARPPAPATPAPALHRVARS